MNQCLVNIVGDMVFITFNQVVKSGSVELWDYDNKTKPVTQSNIHNTNFVNLDAPSVNGKYRLEIIADGEHFSKPISIN